MKKSVAGPASKIDLEPGGSSIQGEASVERALFTPALRIASGQDKARRLYYVSLIALSLAAIFPTLYLIVNREPDKVFVLDGDGTIHIGPLESLHPQSSIFQEVLIQVTKAMFDRTSVGIESPEMVKKLFSAKAIQALNKDVQWELPYLESRNVRQQVSIGEIVPIKNENGYRVYQVTGILNIAGIYKGTKVVDSDPFVVLIALTRNPRWEDKARYPFIVSDFLIRQPKRPDSYK